MDDMLCQVNSISSPWPYVGTDSRECGQTQNYILDLKYYEDVCACVRVAISALLSTVNFGDDNVMPQYQKVGFMVTFRCRIGGLRGKESDTMLNELSLMSRTHMVEGED